LEGPFDVYRRLLGKGEIERDEDQEVAVRALQDFYQNILTAKPQRRFFLSALRFPLVKGLYLWGGVGRGKTWLADLLFETLPLVEKRRQHFHAFMQDIHQLLTQYQGRVDPLPSIAAELARDTRVIFLDEFHVVDIADAVILAQLLKGLFSNGIALVTTSNMLPESLYNDGIQRASFLPAIQLLQENTRVINIGGSRDYRCETIEQMPVYLLAAEVTCEQQFTDEFNKLCRNHQVSHDAALIIASRSIRYKKQAADVIWFSFHELCNGPRHATDYLEIARRFHTLFLDEVPVLDGSRDDSARRFISMIDILYDHRVKLIVSAETLPQQLYSGERLAFEFQRTASRLQEMQSAGYLALAHRS
jgi:cell division protein ZapE